MVRWRVNFVKSDTYSRNVGFSFLRMNKLGQYLDTTGPVDDASLARFFDKRIVLPPKVTDVFIWVHGWQNDEMRALTSARTMFFELDHRIRCGTSMYPRIGEFVPAYIAVHWPSVSTPGPIGYRTMRNRANQMTTRGTAEFLLASLLGYLNATNHRSAGAAVLRAQAGFFVHCLGHSFGGRFLAAAIKAAATPTERIHKVLSAVKRDTAYQFTVDSLCVLQMAAPASAFYSEFISLLDESPLSGPIVLTHTRHDRALCVWHSLVEGQAGIGCKGATSPSTRIGFAVMLDPGTPYPGDAFAKDITNVDASGVFCADERFVGAHSDIWHQETFHLIASVVEQVR